ncbi:MAG: primosomal protein [Sciscionella sp.]
MAQDIVPIELGLTRGDLITLWAPRWREEGEEWEAFLGNEDDLYVFADAAQLAAFVRTTTEHDLADHPAWHVVTRLAAGELMPDESHQYDLVGVPELVADEPDSWTLNELADIVSIVRSIAEVCELTRVEEVLGSSDGFAVLGQGTLPFTGREGQRLWSEMSETVAERWDEVLDALDAITVIPEVDADAASKAQEELAAYIAELESTDEDDDLAEVETEDVTSTDDGTEKRAEAAATTEDEDEDDESVGFWAEIGIDPIKIISGVGEYYTLRCYLDDEPVFLGSDGEIDVFGSPRALATYLTTSKAAESDIAEVTTWDEVVSKANAGELDIQVEDDNTYVLHGLADDIAEGPDSVDPNQLELAVELFSDAAAWADDDSVERGLLPSQSLGWLVSFVLRPDPTRLAPSAPYTAEVEAWRELSADFEDRLRSH